MKWDIKLNCDLTREEARHTYGKFATRAATGTQASWAAHFSVVSWYTSSMLLWLASRMLVVPSETVERERRSVPRHWRGGKEAAQGVECQGGQVNDRLLLFKTACTLFLTFPESIGMENNAYGVYSGLSGTRFYTSHLHAYTRCLCLILFDGVGTNPCRSNLLLQTCAEILGNGNKFFLISILSWVAV